MADTLRTAGAHRVTLDARSRMTVSGVQDVDEFDEHEVIMRTECGRLIVSGSGLHLIRLMPENGELELAGEIQGLQYRNTRAGGKSGGGAFSRLLK